jgi:hypothetical protein
MFKDKETNLRSKLKVYGEFRGELPQFAKYHEVNRTLVGYINKDTKPGTVIRLEVVYYDDQGY